MKKLPLALIYLSLLSSCGFGDNLPRITTTLYPVYYAAKVLVQDAVEVDLLLPVGLDPHAFEPSPNQVISALESDLFMYASPVLEPWVASLADSTESDVDFFDVSASVSIISDAVDPSAEDPHFWLDPLSYGQAVEAMAEIISERFPSLQTSIEENIMALREEIRRVDDAFENLVAFSSRDTIIFAGHYVFGYWNTRYGILHLSPYEGFSSESLPSPEALLLLIQAMETLGTDVIYASELEGTQTAAAIQQSAPNSVILNLETLENATLEDREGLVSYETLMLQNIEALKLGLGYVQ